MQKTQLITSAIASVALLSSLFIAGSNIAQAKPSISLLNAKCVDSGPGSAKLQDINVSIGRAVYSSRFFLGPGSRFASLTCKIKPDNRPQSMFQTLNLGFGMRDNDNNSPSVEVRIYLDGKQTENKTVSPSQQVMVALDVSNVSNVSIEAVCSSPNQYCDRVYFFNAALERQTASQSAPQATPTPKN
jgi:hypothetical protein